MLVLLRYSRCAFSFSISIGLSQQIWRRLIGRCDVGLVVGSIVCRVAECGFHGVLLLFLGNDLLQGQIGVDLVRVLLRSQLEQERQVDALQRGQLRLLRGVGGLRLVFKVGDIRLSRLLDRKSVV